MKGKKKTFIGNKRKNEDIIKYGRKKKSSGESGKHNKFSDDNLRRKCKHIILDILMEFINKLLEDIYKENLGQGILIKKLFTMNQEQIKNAYIDYNKMFLKKTLGEIFSEDICKRYTNYPQEHNKNLIIRLLNENNEELKNKFTRIFNIKFEDVLRHIKGSEIIKDLEGLKDINEVLKEYEDDPNYYQALNYYVFNFEEIMERKKSRKPRD